MTQDRRGIKMNTLKRFDERYAQLISESTNLEEAFDGENKLTSLGFSKVQNEGWLSFTKKYGEATVTINEQDSEFDVQVNVPGVGDFSYPRISRGHYYGGPVSEVFSKIISEIDADLENKEECRDVLEAFKADLQKVLE